MQIITSRKARRNSSSKLFRVDGQFSKEQSNLAAKADKEYVKKILGFPDAPIEVFAIGKNESAAIWWTPSDFPIKHKKDDENNDENKPNKDHPKGSTKDNQEESKQENEKENTSEEEDNKDDISITAWEILRYKMHRSKCNIDILLYIHPSFHPDIAIPYLSIHLSAYLGL